MICICYIFYNALISEVSLFGRLCNICIPLRFSHLFRHCLGFCLNFKKFVVSVIIIAIIQISFIWYSELKQSEINFLHLRLLSKLKYLNKIITEKRRNRMSLDFSSLCKFPIKFHRSFAPTRLDYTFL